VAAKFAASGLKGVAFVIRVIVVKECTGMLSKARREIIVEEIGNPVNTFLAKARIAVGIRTMITPIQLFPGSIRV
jgi:hypothetical protein